MEYVKRKVLEKYVTFNPAESTVAEWISKLKEFPEDAEVEINTWEDSSSYDVYINTYRMETDEELQARKEKESYWTEIAKENRYKTYLKLKEEFENDKTDSTVQDN